MLLRGNSQATSSKAVTTRTSAFLSLISWRISAILSAIFLPVTAVLNCKILFDFGAGCSLQILSIKFPTIGYNVLPDVSNLKVCLTELRCNYRYRLLFSASSIANGFHNLQEMILGSTPTPAPGDKFAASHIPMLGVVGSPSRISVQLLSICLRACW